MAVVFAQVGLKTGSLDHHRRFFVANFTLFKLRWERAATINKHSPKSKLHSKGQNAKKNYQTHHGVLGHEERASGERRQRWFAEIVTTVAGGRWWQAPQVKLRDCSKRTIISEFVWIIDNTSHAPNFWTWECVIGSVWLVNLGFGLLSRLVYYLHRFINWGLVVCLILVNQGAIMWQSYGFVSTNNSITHFSLF